MSAIQSMQPNKKQTHRKPRKSIKLDRVNPADFRKHNMIYSCEQCSHFDESTSHCTLGYQSSLHRQAIQLQRFYSNSHMAFCRFLEID